MTVFRSPRQRSVYLFYFDFDCFFLDECFFSGLLLITSILADCIMQCIVQFVSVCLIHICNLSIHLQFILSFICSCISHFCIIMSNLCVRGMRPCGWADSLDEL